MTFCQHNQPLGSCRRCDDEVDALVRKATTSILHSRDVGLNGVQHDHFMRIVAGAALRRATPSAVLPSDQDIQMTSDEHTGHVASEQPS